MQPQSEHRPCQDVFGHNSKLMGGYAGMAQCLGIGNEFQGDGTPHGHALVSLANLYQHKDLSEIAEILESRCKEIVADTAETPDDVLERVKIFSDHVCRVDPMDHEAHVKNLDKFAKDFELNNVGRPINNFLAVALSGERRSVATGSVVRERWLGWCNIHMNGLVITVGNCRSL